MTMQAGIRDRMSAQRSPTTGVVHVGIAEGIAVRALDDASKSVYFRNPAHDEDVSRIGVIFTAPNRRVRGSGFRAERVNGTPLGWVE